MSMKTRLRILILAMLIIVLLMGSSPEQHGKYIIVFHDSVNVNTAVPDIARAHGLEVGFTYQHALKGMSASVPAGRLMALQNDPRVAYVVEDMVRTIAAQTTPTGVERIFADTNANLDIDGTDDWRVDVDVAVIDTGVDYEHPDLNVVGGVNCASGGPFGGGCVAGGDDDHYHGTHVAGTIAALDDDQGVVGVAPGARIWAVKVLSKRGSGYTSWIVAGIDWVTANADTIEVANMSLGGSGFNQAEYDAIQGAVNAGVAFAVAAGNSDADANNYSPAAFDNVLTVSALADFNGAPDGGAPATCRSDVDDTLANFSNWGTAVDIAAPGVCILSTYPLEQGSYGTISGTSMASPHAAGALALLASNKKPGDPPPDASYVYALYDLVINAGNTNWTDDSGDGILEPLLDVSTFSAALIAGAGGDGGGGGGGSDTPPTVTITSPSNGAPFDSSDSISFTGSASDAEDNDLTSSIVWTSNLEGGQIGTGGSFTITLSVGEHLITAEVTDSGNNTVSDTITITVTSSGGGGGGGGIQLSVNAYKVKGIQHADLTWSGATTTNVDIYRNGSLTTTENDGAFPDSTGQKGGGTATYQVCEAGTSNCSNEVEVIW